MFGFVGLLAAILFPSVAPAGSLDLVLSQETGEGEEQPAGQEEEAEGQESQSGEGTAGETGAGEEETESATEEIGPPWTYQMARLGFLLLLVLGLGIGFWYWRLIARRQRTGI